jgi:hypothetical protein
MLLTITVNRKALTRSELKVFPYNPCLGDMNTFSVFVVIFQKRDEFECQMKKNMSEG